MKEQMESTSFQPEFMVEDLGINQLYRNKETNQIKRKKRQLLTPQKIKIVWLGKPIEPFPFKSISE